MELIKKPRRRLAVFFLIAFSAVLLGAAATLVREALHAAKADRNAGVSRFATPRPGR